MELMELMELRELGEQISFERTSGLIVVRLLRKPVV